MSTPRPEPTLEYAVARDAADPLRDIRHLFELPRREDGSEVAYFCGNSLGLMPRRSRERVTGELAKWADLAVRGHFETSHPWMPYHEFLTAGLARIVGAKPQEVVAMNSLTANLHFMMVSFYRPVPGRDRILIEKKAFPSDRYAVESQIRFHGLDPASCLIEVEPRPGESCLRDEDLMELIAREGERIALVLMPGVQYYTGQWLDMGAITKAGHARGAKVGFDLAHAVGNVPLDLHGWGADFAVWCHYKYMNSGPGAVGGCFVHERHAEDPALPRFAGWWGHDKSSRFLMPEQFRPIHGAEGWQLSNPPIFSLAAILGSLEVFQEAGGMEPLRRKSLELTGYLEALLDARASGDVEIVTPREPARRGCQLSLRIVRPGVRGRVVHETLERAGIVGDFREPDVIRVAPVPLYNRFQDVHELVDRLVTNLRKEAP